MSPIYKILIKILSGKKFISPSITIIGDIVDQHKKFKWKEENLDGVYFKNPRKRKGDEC